MRDAIRARLELYDETGNVVSQRDIQAALAEVDRLRAECVDARTEAAELRGEVAEANLSKLAAKQALAEVTPHEREPVPDAAWERAAAYWKRVAEDTIKTADVIDARNQTYLAELADLLVRIADAWKAGARAALLDSQDGHDLSDVGVIEWAKKLQAKAVDCTHVTGALVCCRCGKAWGDS